MQSRAIAADAADESAAVEFHQIEAVRVRGLANRLCPVHEDQVPRLQFRLDLPVPEKSKDRGMGESRSHIFGEGIGSAINLTRKRVARANGILNYRNIGVVADTTIIHQVTDAKPDFLKNTIGQ